MYSRQETVDLLIVKEILMTICGALKGHIWSKFAWI